ncbi:MAG: PEP-utilizing enzyme, partial [Bacteroidota bacterium]
ALVSNRENLRFRRTQAFGMVRKMFRALGRKFASAQLLANAEDVFYLKQGEIFDFMEGRAVDTNLKVLVSQRQKQYEDWAEVEPAPRITTYGPVYHTNDLTTNEAEAPLEGDLEGIGCCPGQVTGRVRVVRDPQSLRDLQGDILVCMSTDPGWVPLFPTASAILVARGSLLSHAAIVAREMGKPCIVGVPGLLQYLKTGDRVSIDGRTGQIQRLENVPGKESDTPVSLNA